MRRKPREFVIGDVHGCIRTFTELLFRKLEIRLGDKIYLLGDYIDRGPSSKEVIDFILELQNIGFDVFPLMGNHEKMLLDSSKSLEHFELWLRNGCMTTLDSFGIMLISQMSQEYLDFFAGLPYFYEIDNFVLVHGGMNFDLPDPLTDMESMVWLRNDSVDIKKIKNKRLIVGHTPVPHQIIELSLETNKIMLDGGCVYLNRHPNLGYLCALELNSMSLVYQRNIDFA